MGSARFHCATLLLFLLLKHFKFYFTSCFVVYSDLFLDPELEPVTELAAPGLHISVVPATQGSRCGLTKKNNYN